MSQSSPRQAQQQRFNPFRRRDSPRTSPETSAPRPPPHHPRPSTTHGQFRPTAFTARPDASNRTPRRPRDRRSWRDRHSGDTINNNTTNNESSGGGGDDTSVDKEDEEHDFEWVDPLIPIVVFGPFAILAYGAVVFIVLGMKAWIAGIPLDSILLFL